MHRRKPTRRQAECTHTGVQRRHCDACQREREALPPRYLVKSRILGCRAEADAPTAPPRSPPHNAGTASLTRSLSPPAARALDHLAFRTGLPSAIAKGRLEEEEEEEEEFT